MTVTIGRRELLAALGGAAAAWPPAALLIIAALVAAVPALAHSWYPLACCGNVSAIERAIVCMRMPGLADLRQPISRGFCTQLQAVAAPAFFTRAAQGTKLIAERSEF